MVQRFSSGEQVFLLDKASGFQVQFHVSPKIVVEQAATLVIPERIDLSMAGSEQAPDGIVAADIKNQEFRAVIGFFFTNHPAVGLIGSISANAKVPDRFAQVRR